MHTPRKDHVSRLQEGNEVEISQQNPPMLAPSETSEVQAPELWRNNFLLFKPPRLGVLLWRPKLSEIELGTGEWAAAVTDTYSCKNG